MSGHRAYEDRTRADVRVPTPAPTGEEPDRLRPEAPAGGGLLAQDLAQDAPVAERPVNLFPEPKPETDEERLSRELTESARGDGDRPPPKADNIADAASATFRRCEEDLRRAAEQGRPIHPDTAGRMPVADPLGEVTDRAKACLDTPEGERLKKQVVELARTDDGARVVIDTVRRLKARAEAIGSAAWDATKEAAKTVAAAIVHVAAAVGGGIVTGVKAVGSGIVTGAKAVGGALARFGRWVWGGIKSAASATWEATRTAGKAIGRAATAVWNGVTWVATQLWDKSVGVFARIAHWVANLPARIGRLLLGLWEGVRSVRPWALDWWQSLGSAGTWLGLLRWLGSRLIDLIEILGVGEAYETIQDFLKFNTRTLNSTERAAATLIFGTSLNLDLVRLDEHAVIGPAFSHREYTSFHTINGWGPITPDTLIHELTHVWQYERAGAIYMPQALHAQIWGAGYTYGGIAGLTAAKTAGTGFGDFNREQQAQIVQDFSTMHQSNPDAAVYAHFVAAVSTLTAAQLIALLPP
ncbi:hypothetical protein GCM10010112_12740 [Actinoplanes lobatus]|uniref:Uncharacterized protein n=1 Tax=Actinoplanes lobatus TaxID=113568 RepID=A0A7W7HMQ4_9ACTN|nr:hypothetical protein [Actinoplanes lobatus]MBB4753112.1 hypothetical protein [Actinoplanes lobatus]GGN58731.1 hypothetical protein GCM10010112_12740 [Actinoplanes lobatus]GIE43028.1 hypothetical protein Alo02nite_59260 [Actinoplanes lobatus]